MTEPDLKDLLRQLAAASCALSDLVEAQEDPALSRLERWRLSKKVAQLRAEIAELYRRIERKLTTLSSLDPEDGRPAGPAP